MSFFSYLTLAANCDVRFPSPEELAAVFAATGVSKPSNYPHGDYNLHGDITALFDDASAKPKSVNGRCGA